MSQKKCFSEDFLCAALVVGVVFGIIAGMAILAFAYPIFQSKEWADWIQAAGVIGALGVAIWIPHNDRRMAATKEKNSQLSKDREMVHSLSILAGHAARAMVSSTRKIKAEERPIRIDRLQDVQESFRVMLAKDLPSCALPDVLAIQCEIAYQISAIELHNSHQNNLSTKSEKASTRTFKVREFEEDLRKLRDCLQQSLKLGSGSPKSELSHQY